MIALLMHSSVSGDLYSVTSVEEILPYFEDVDMNTMVVFDLDETLITMKDMILRPCGHDLRYEYIYRLSKKYSPRKLDYLFSLVADQAETVLVDPRWVDIIDRLQCKTPYVIAETAVDPGPFGIFQAFEDQRIKLLEGFEIYFDRVSKYLPDRVFDNLGKRTHPLLKQGVLFSGGTPKGIVLEALLNEMDELPEKVIFIDDREKNVFSVSQAMNRLGIDYVGLHYSDKSFFNDKCDAEVAEVQFRSLDEQGHWVSDEAAKELLLEKPFVEENPFEDWFSYSDCA